MRDFNVIIEFGSISFKGWQRVWLRETSYAQVTPQTSSTNFSQTHSNPGETKTMEGTTPELGLFASGVQNPVPSAVATPL